MEELDKCREEIDKINSEILECVGNRVKIVREIARVKCKKGMCIKDPEREKKMLDKLALEGEKYDLDRDFVIDMFKKIIEFSICKEEQENGRN
jgi:chorismate mutase